jgi:hypothetical protein
MTNDNTNATKNLDLNASVKGSSQFLGTPKNELGCA